MTRNTVHIITIFFILSSPPMRANEHSVNLCSIITTLSSSMLSESLAKNDLPLNKTSGYAQLDFLFGQKYQNATESIVKALNLMKSELTPDVSAGFIENACMNEYIGNFTLIKSLRPLVKKYCSSNPDTVHNCINHILKGYIAKI